MKIRRIAGAALVAALAVVALLPAVPSVAQGPVAGRLALDTGVVQIDGKPGGVSADRFKLINASETAVTVQSFVEDLATDSSGGVVAAPRGSGLPSAASWVKVDKKEIDVPGSGVATVDVSITIPKDVKAGGYYASVTFDVDDRSAPESRLTHAILVRILGAGASASARLVSFEMKTPSYSGKVEMTVTVENLGRIHAIGAGRIDVVDTFGNRIGQLPVPTIVVMPGRQRIVRVVYETPPVAGRLKSTAVMSFDGTESVASDTGYVLIWWLVAALTAVFVLFAIALLRIAGVAGPKAAARRSARAAAAPPPPPAKERKRGRKKGDAEQVAAAAPAPPPASPFPPGPSTPPLRMPTPPPTGIIPPGGPPPMPAGAVPPSAGAVLPAPPPPAPPADKPDQSFWGPDDDEAPAPRVRDEPDVEPVEEPAPVVPARADTWALDSLTDDDDDDDEDDEDDELEDDYYDVFDDDDEGEEDDEDEGEGDEDEGEGVEDEGDEDEGDADEDEVAGTARPLPDDDEPDAAWPGSPAAESSPARPARPVPVALPSGRRTAPPAAATPDVDEDTDEAPPLKPAGRESRTIGIAGLPPLRTPEPLPASHWTPPPSDQTLDRPAGGSAMALRRAEVALRMIGGKTGETGAILDSGLDLLYSVRNDPDVVARVEQEYEETRNRRRLGPLALALFAVDSRVAPEALLDSYATASKVVAERVRRAILACDPADIRRHKDLIAALPQGRRDQLGL